ncbi:MAG: hypothetical protein KC910_31840 [Candidatus Eremiobacteraeota bacterium]|nr:hypothetical protein [Candidatus Eremiobacteraeota bacterium]
MLEAYAVFGILTTAQVEELTAHLEAGEVLRTVVRSLQARLGLTPPGLEKAQASARIL